jgi:hypothetical protein
MWVELCLLEYVVWTVALLHLCWLPLCIGLLRLLWLLLLLLLLLLLGYMAFL